MALEDLFPKDRRVSKIPVDQAGPIEGAAKLLGRLLKPKSEEVITTPVQEDKATVTEPEQKSTPVEEPKEKVVVEGPGKFVSDAIKSVPFMQAFSGMLPIASIIGEGLSRYESAKTQFIEGFAKAGGAGAGLQDIGKTIKGEARNEFNRENSPLKTSDQPELGDFFRKAGFAEMPSAIGGLALDLATDAIWGLPALPMKIEGKLAKTAMNTLTGELKPATESLVDIAKGSKVGKEVTENVTKFKNEKLGSAARKVQEEMLKPTGLDEYATKLTPKVEGAVEDLVDTFNKSKSVAGEWIDTFGKQASEIYVKSGAKDRVNQFAQKISNKLDETGVKAWYATSRVKTLVDSTVEMMQGKGIYDKLPESFKNALRLKTGRISVDNLEGNYLAGQLDRSVKAGSIEAKWANEVFRGDDTNLAKLPDEARKVLMELRGIRQANAERIATSLEDIAVEDLNRIMAGYDIDPNSIDAVSTLRDRILNTGMDYSTRSYEMFLPNSKYVPSAAQTQAAKKALIEEWEISEEEATKILNGFMDKKDNPWTNIKKVNTKNFKQKKDLPEELRKFLGEVEDPRYNIMNTLIKQSEIANTYDVFKFGKEQGFFVNEKSVTHSVPVPEGGPLSWGMAHGTYTTPEIAEYLGFIKEYRQEMDGFIMNWLKTIKTGKVVFSPKSMGHQILGNTMYFAPLAGVSPMTHLPRFKEAWGVMSDINKVMSGELPRTHKAYQIYKEAVEHNVLGNEVANADQLTFLGKHLDKPWERVKDWREINSFKDLVQETGKFYSAQDGLYKLATYLEYTRGRGMKPLEAATEMYKWYPNPKEAGRLAQMARSTAMGVFFANPFTTFASESHRIMLNAINDSPRTRFLFGAMAGTKLAYNSAIMLALGYGVQDVMSLVNSRPEAASEVMFNPADPAFDFNLKYIDPFNTSGIFAPLMSLSGATGVNPFDYLLDFTQFSPEFGYSNFLLNAITPLATGKGKFGEDLSMADKLGGVIDAHLSTSFTRDLPKALNPNEDSKEQARRALRFFGMDVEDRNADYIKREVVKSVKEKMEKNEDLTSAVKVLDFMGFDSEKIINSTAEKIRRAKLAQKRNDILSL